MGFSFRTAIIIVGCVIGLGLVTSAGEYPYWSRDLDGNRIDDNIEAVQSQGWAAAFENGNVNARKKLDVTQGILGAFTYGVYVKYDTQPTASMEQALLTHVSGPAHRFLYIPYIRARATHTQIQGILSLPGVVRVECAPLFYAVNDNVTKTMRAAPSNFEAFPDAMAAGITGKGVVIAILDSGVNDAPDALTGYPGHESLMGKFVGGGNFSNPDPALNTPVHLSENPVDRSPDFSHGSHVAGTALGTGGPAGMVADGNYGFYRGVAPDAKLVDCKVLSDAGVGGGAPDGLEWCIYHRNDDWGGGYRGVQVVNMSLGSLLNDSDGTDASSEAANAAVRAGIVVCASTGNDGNTNYISAPSAGDRVISVGASIDANTVDRSDDVVAFFSNEGPRQVDPDGDHLDEMKPSVCPPGGGVTSVEGVLTANGHTYVTTNGTSMSSPVAAGICALILQADPGLDTEDVRRILQDTAEHRTSGGKQDESASDPFGIDPNYHPSWGWGNPDVYAAVMEALYPRRTQVVEERGVVAPGGIDVHWVTQRELATVGFHVLRADPLYGNPGPFAMLNTDPIPAAGDPEIHAHSNRTPYVFEDRDPALATGETYWYRIRWKDTQGRVHDEPAFPIRYDPPTVLATVQWSVIHDYLDNDALVLLGSGTDASDPILTAHFVFPGQGTGAADSMHVVPGNPSVGGTKQWFFSRRLTDRDFGAAQVLPPSAENPWFLYVKEGGFVDANGRVADFRITVHGPGGDVLYTPPIQLPLQTVENVAHVIWIPANPILSLNHAPVLDAVGDKTVQEGRTLSFEIHATDADGHALTYSAPTLPSGASFNPSTRTFSWNIPYSAVSQTTTMQATFHVEDALGSSDEETIGIRVHDVDPNTNLGPYWNALADVSVTAGYPMSFKVSAVDPEYDALVYAAEVLPQGAAFDPGTRTFSWTPNTRVYGDYTALFSVTDGTHPPVNEDVQIVVRPSTTEFTDCENQLAVVNGSVSMGSSDLGTADFDTVALELPFPVVRLMASLSWSTVTAVDLDYVMRDADGNAVGSSATSGNPEILTTGGLEPGTYYFIVEGFLVAAETPFTIEVTECKTTGVTPETELRAYLAQSIPNPVRVGAAAHIRFGVPARGDARLDVFDLRGARVNTLLDETLEPGVRDVVWTGQDQNGRRVAPGVYFYRLEVKGQFVATRRLILLR
ncbi:MAG TPA: S8 family serine peptidase [Candidatus Eisenbacteria bacterium]|nr:S8 family serine peptidase [Candidatus Eisenbacteria bacterium]